MGRSEPVKEGFEKTGSHSIAKKNKQHYGQKNANDFFPVLFVYEKKQKTQIKKEPCPLIRK